MVLFFFPPLPLPLPFVLTSSENALICFNVLWEYSEISKVSGNTIAAQLPFAQISEVRLFLAVHFSQITQTRLILIPDNSFVLHGLIIYVDY